MMKSDGAVSKLVVLTVRTILGSPVSDLCVDLEIPRWGMQQ